MNYRQLANQTGYSRPTLFKLKERGLILASRLSDNDYTSRLIKLLRVRRQIQRFMRAEHQEGCV